MKNIYLIGGTMGAGKTTICQILKNKLPNCVFLTGTGVGTCTLSGNRQAAEEIINGERGKRH